MENKVSVTISDEAVTAINEAINTIIQNLPDLINLTYEERKSIPKMGDKTVAFVIKNLEYAKRNPRVVPEFLDMNEFEKDALAVSGLHGVLVPIQQLSEKLDDTTMQAGRVRPILLH